MEHISQYSLQTIRRAAIGYQNPGLSRHSTSDHATAQVEHPGGLGENTWVITLPTSAFSLYTIRTFANIYCQIDIRVV